MDQRSEVVKRALGYPYAIPPSSFVQVGDRTLEPAAVEVDLSRRIPLLAYGSNAAPEVLGRKLAPSPQPVPVLRALLHDFDVVYSAHVTRYGAVPATLRRSRGTEAPAHVAYLTREQLELIAATEPNYFRATLADRSCSLAGGGSPPALQAFLSRHGCLRLDGTGVALAPIASRGRTLPAMDQRQVLERVRDILRPGRDLERFIVECVEGVS